MTDQTTLDQDALKYILGLPAGRKVLWDILAAAGLYRQPHARGDSSGTDFNCGALNVGLIVYADCLASSPDLTAMMIKEQGNYDNRTGNNASASSDSSGRSDSDSSGPGSEGLPLTLGLDRLTGRRLDN